MSIHSRYENADAVYTDNFTPASGCASTGLSLRHDVAL
jgi:hypothetical protein